LVDCDLRNASLTRKLAPGARAGFLDVISSKQHFEEVIWTDPSTNLTFLPGAIKVRFAHTSEFLASDAAKNLFDELRKKYDYIIVDLSPLAPVVDARATTGFIDSYVFVVEWGRTKYDVVEQAFNDAQGIYENMLGVVLNKADMNVLARYSGYSGYYKNRYYARYGYTD
jgi:polysaccharide biosynthesis transport protein